MTKPRDARRGSSSGSSTLDQDDVLRHKDHTTRGSIGLQQWDEDADARPLGTGGSGTAERASKIAAGQAAQSASEGKRAKDDRAARDAR